MKRQHAIAIVLAIVVLAVLVFLRSPEQDMVMPEQPPVSEGERLPETAPTEDEYLGPVHGENFSEAPALQAYRARQLFAQRVSEFFAQSETLSAAAREAEATALLVQVEQFEARGELSAAEAVSLRLGLLRSSADEVEFTTQATHIIEAYQARHAQAMAEYLANPPAAFVDYKARERAIVEEVRQLETIPGGISRGQYLRERLQAAREESYAAVHRDE